ncbi:MAG: hypothetical protein JWL60_2544 [Gemmatimonadetes bacterium]|jgi:hypothetical protein|nr:hypothetical protein [Gemmatimonadota bacterium]
MGGKSDMATREDRPESGGTDPRGQRSDTGLQEKEKQKFAQDMAEKAASVPEHPKNADHAAFTVGSEPNNAKNASLGE